MTQNSQYAISFDHKRLKDRLRCTIQVSCVDHQKNFNSFVHVMGMFPTPILIENWMNEYVLLNHPDFKAKLKSIFNELSELRKKLNFNIDADYSLITDEQKEINILESYIYFDSSDQVKVSATPETLFRQMKRLGLIECDELFTASLEKNTHKALYLVKFNY